MRRALSVITIVAFASVGLAIVATQTRADLENQVFTSKTDRLRLVVPRGWRATDQPSYPGLVLWMMRSQPEGHIVLTAEPFTRELYCSWPVSCRLSKEPLATRMACALRQKLVAVGMRVGPTQAGPKENEEAGVASVWIEYDDGKHFLRQAIAFDAERIAVSLVLSTKTNEARVAHARAFEQALRTLHVLAPDTPTAETTAAVPADAGVVGETLADAGAKPAAAFDSAPTPRISPIGPCPQ
jgi:hypothetical protein